MAVRWHFSGKAYARETDSSKTRLAACPSSFMCAALLRLRPLRSQHSLLGEQVGEAQ